MLFEYYFDNLSDQLVALLKFYVFLAEKQGNKGKINGAENQNKTEPTWVEDLFQGTFTNETRCLTCETVRITMFCNDVVCYLFVTILYVFHVKVKYMLLYNITICTACEISVIIVLHVTYNITICTTWYIEQY